MAHTAKNKTLGRKAKPRRALLISQSNALLLCKRIITTKAKAKALARFIAQIITRARTRSIKDLNYACKQAFSILRSKPGVRSLFHEVLPKIQGRTGGYTRIIKLKKRQGDAADMGMIELVDFNTLLQKTKRKKTRRGKKGIGLEQKKGEELMKKDISFSKTKEQPAVATGTKEKSGKQ